MYRKRFGLTHHPLPRNAQGKTFFDKAPCYLKLKRHFQNLIEDPGLGLLIGDAGVGTTASIRNLCSQLPKPDYMVIYLCDTAVSPLDLYRSLAFETGIRPAHRRGQLVGDIKRGICHMVDERGVQPVLIIDRAHYLSDRFLDDLGDLVSAAFDSRQILTLWLVGQPELARRLRMLQHASLDSRISSKVRLEPFDRETFALFIDHGLRAAGATQNLLNDPARELLYRASRGIPAVAGKILRAALQRAHERDQNFIDDHTLEAVLDEEQASVEAK